jgi:alpha-L-rhamnosidase
MVMGSRYTVETKPLVQTVVPPVETQLADGGTLFLDFGRAAFGTLLLPSSNDPQCDPTVVHLGEKLAPDGRIDRHPRGSVRYIRIQQALDQGPGLTRIVIPPDERNTGPAAIKMPVEIGEVYPFRYAEIERAAASVPSWLRL